MRATFTQYELPAWGVGELWTDDDLVLAHEFRFETHPDVSANGSQTAPPKGARGPLSGTVPRDLAHVGNAFVPNVQRSASASARASDPATATAPVRAPETDADSRSSSGRRPPGAQESARDLAEDLVGRFRAFFAGEEVELGDVRIDLDWATPFQRAVASALRAVPRGEVVSYGELAALAGFPGAARAAGTFCARNRFMLIVPCHRVVGAHGPGSYGSAGIQTKRRLLALEGVDV